MWHICALASVTQSCVRSIYPAESVQINRASQARNVLNVTIFPRIQNVSLGMCSVMWSRVGATHGLWQPNHFVPCLQNLQQSMSAIGKLQMSHLSLLKTPVVHVSIKWGLSEALTLTIRHSHESNQIKANHHRLQRKLMHHSRLIILTEIHYIKYKKCQQQKREKEWVLSKQKSKRMSRRKSFMSIQTKRSWQSEETKKTETWPFTSSIVFKVSDWYCSSLLCVMSEIWLPRQLSLCSPRQCSVKWSK